MKDSKITDKRKKDYLKKSTWDYLYEKLIEYLAQHKNRIPNYKEDKFSISLYQWYFEQKKKVNSLPPEKREKIEKIKFSGELQAICAGKMGSEI